MLKTETAVERSLECAVTITGTRSALREWLREQQAVGYTHFSIHIRHGHPAMLDEWADVIVSD